MKSAFFSAACLLVIPYAPAAAKDGPTQGPNATVQAQTAPSGTDLARQLEDSSGLDSIPKTGGAGHRLIGRVDAADNAVFGVGVWRMPKVEIDPSRHNLMRNPTGRTSGVAAVGFNFSF